MSDVVEYRNTKDLYNWKDNPRAIKKDKFEELKNRITRHGQIKPLIITKQGEVLGGNMRLRAMKELGIDEAWVSVVSPATEAEKIEIALTDNEEMGYYEDQALAELIDKYKEDIDLAKYSVHLSQPKTLEEILREFSPEEIVEDEAPEVSDEEPISKLGEVYQLGRHRLMCGDSTKVEDVEKLMDGNKADMVFTDPPYGVNYTNNKRIDGHEYKRESSYKKIENDDLPPEKFIEFMNITVTNMNMFLKEKAVLYLCTSDKPDFRQSYEDACKQNGLKYSAYLIWDKGNFGFGFQNYRASHEGILYYKKGSVEDMWVGGQDKGTILNIKKDANKEYNHPTQKPVALPAYCIGNHKADKVLDIFGGSGSTLIACEQTDRTCYMMELDPKYCDVIRKRYENFINANHAVKTMK